MVGEAIFLIFVGICLENSYVTDDEGTVQEGGGLTGICLPLPSGSARWTVQQIIGWCFISTALHRRNSQK